MKALALTALALAIPVTASAATPQDPAKAADAILKQCVEHAYGRLAIKGQNGRELDAKGLVYQLNPPEFLSSTQVTNMGRAEYAKSPSTEGEIWGVGYDGGSCMVVTMATYVEPIEKVYLDYFNQPNLWHAEKISGGQKGERRLQYTVMPTRATKLTATVSLRNEEGISSVTIRYQNR